MRMQMHPESHCCINSVRLWTYVPVCSDYSVLKLLLFLFGEVLLLCFRCLFVEMYKLGEQRVTLSWWILTFLRTVSVAFLFTRTSSEERRERRRLAASSARYFFKLCVANPDDKFLFKNKNKKTFLWKEQIDFSQKPHKFGMSPTC